MTVVAVALLVVAAGQAFVATQQVRLDRLDRGLATAVARDQNLQLTRAQLASPSRILARRRARARHGCAEERHLPRSCQSRPVHRALGVKGRDVTRQVRRGGDRRSPAAPIRRARVRCLTVLMSLAAVGLAIRLSVVQVVDAARYTAGARSEVERTVELPATRGTIYDSAGDVLAVSVPRATLLADDLQITAPASEARRLGHLLGVPTARLTAELSERNGHVVLARGLDDAVVAGIEKHDFAGLAFVADSVRVSTGGDVFQPLLGVVNTTGVGYEGIEEADNGLLAGRAGRETVALRRGGTRSPAGRRTCSPPDRAPGSSSRSTSRCRSR